MLVIPADAVEAKKPNVIDEALGMLEKEYRLAPGYPDMKITAPETGRKNAFVPKK